LCERGVGGKRGAGDLKPRDKERAKGQRRKKKRTKTVQKRKERRRKGGITGGKREKQKARRQQGEGPESFRKEKHKKPNTGAGGRGGPKKVRTKWRKINTFFSTREGTGKAGKQNKSKKNPGEDKRCAQPVWGGGDTSTFPCAT